jgi:hypothetical protein
MRRLSDEQGRRRTGIWNDQFLTPKNLPTAQDLPAILMTRVDGQLQQLAGRRCTC